MLLSPSIYEMSNNHRYFKFISIVPYYCFSFFFFASHHCSVFKTAFIYKHPWNRQGDDYRKFFIIMCKLHYSVVRSHEITFLFSGTPCWYCFIITLVRCMHMVIRRHFQYFGAGLHVFKLFLKVTSKLRWEEKETGGQIM